MSAITAIAGADALERTRRFTFLVIVAAALYAGYLYVPAAGASYSTVTVNDHRGIYNAAYVGAAITVLTTLFLSLAGFFFVRGSVERDRELHVDGVVGASPVSRAVFLLGKWLSNLGVLVAVAAITYLAAIGMQEWHGEDRAFDVLAYALPFLFVSVPALSLVSALAVAFDVIPLLRGVIGGAIYVMVIWMALVIAPVQQSAGLTRHATFDPLGATSIVASLYQSERATYAREKDRADVSIGGTPAPAGGFKLYRFAGVVWTPQILLERAAWFVASILLVLALSPFFDCFRREAASGPKVNRRIDVARFIPNLPGLSMLRAEFALLVNGTSIWWMVGALVLAVLCAVLPIKQANDFVLPLALIWPLERISTLGARERQYNVSDILAATPGSAWRNLFTQWLAGTLLSSFIVAGYLARSLVAGHPLTAIAVCLGLGAMVAAALALGTFTGAPRAFQALFLVAWYLGPIEHLPALDIASAAQHQPVVASIAALAMIVAAIGYAGAQRVTRGARR